jgi:hypothetical protein
VVWNAVRAQQARAGRHVAIYWDGGIRLEQRPSTVQYQTIPRYTLSASGFSSNLRKVIAAQQLSLIRRPDAPIFMRNARQCDTL